MVWGRCRRLRLESRVQEVHGIPACNFPPVVHAEQNTKRTTMKTVNVPMTLQDLNTLEDLIKRRIVEGGKALPIQYIRHLQELKTYLQDNKRRF